MDFLFVPGTTTEEVLGSNVLSRRPTTTLITLPPRQNHIAGLLAKLAAGGSITPPIGDLRFVAHGLETGNYYIPLSATVAAPADFEKAVAADTSNTVRIASALVTPSGGGSPTTIAVRLTGCNIGQAQPFVAKLQQAMTPTGATLNMTAPLHFDELHAIHGGWVEYLAHKFTLKVAQQFLTPQGKDDRPALLAAFDSAGFTYLDKTAIPTAAWSTWVPTAIHPPSRSWKQSFDIKVDLSPPVGTQTAVTVHREYRYERTPFTWTWSAPDPGNDHDRIELLRTSLPLGTLNGEHMYDSSYPWPIYERFGFTSIDDYVDNLPWKVTVSGGTLHYRATRHEYTVMLPITDPPVAPANPALKFYNFFPLTAAAGQPVLNLDETNTDLFLNL